MSDLFPDTLDDLIAEAERELAKRLEVYPRMISGGRLSAETCERRLRRQRGIIAQLKADRLEKIGSMG